MSAWEESPVPCTQCPSPYFASLWTSEEFSDLTVQCQGQVFRLHRAVVCTQSDFFYKACTGGFKEARSNTINMDGDDPVALEMMLEWMYFGTFTPPTKEYDPDDCISEKDWDGSMNLANSAVAYSRMSLFAKVYALGDKYNVTRLKDHVLKRFERRLSSYGPSADGIHEQWPALVTLVYTSTPPSDTELRGVISQQAAKFSQDFLQPLFDNALKEDNKLVKKHCDLWNNATAAVDDFATDVLKQAVKIHKKEVEMLKRKLLQYEFPNGRWSSYSD